jgi:hypothetical protein
MRQEKNASAFFDIERKRTWNIKCSGRTILSRINKDRLFLPAATDFYSIL